jgi:N-acylneuraminate cytidylyltransferase
VVLSTDDQDLLVQGNAYGIQLINREPHLASDTAGMLEVMLDAIKKQKSSPEYLMLLQPTSPFRTTQHIEDAFELFEAGDDAVVAVNEPAGHPFYTLFQEENGYISKFQKNQVVRRQDLPPMYDVNGLIYLFRVAEMRKHSWIEFEKIRPLVVPKWQAIDIDNEEDWWLAETLYAGMEAKR